MFRDSSLLGFSHTVSKVYREIIIRIKEGFIRVKRSDGFKQILKGLIQNTMWSDFFSCHLKIKKTAEKNDTKNELADNEIISEGH